MADPIDPRLMQALLARPAWSMAVHLGDTAVNRLDQFAIPPPPPPALVVPVDVRALYVPANHSEEYVRLPMELGGPASEEDIPTPPFSDPEERAPGIHLHWALPDGLLQGELADDDEQGLQLRSLPNRWLVVRMTGPANSALMTLKAWVVASETGQVYELEDFPEGPSLGDGDQLDPEALDGVVGGSPSWTAGYDATRNRFSFFDPLEGVNANTITSRLASYVVVGWWSERASDPLSSSYWPFSVSRVLNSLGWTASPAPMDGAVAQQVSAVNAVNNQFIAQRQQSTNDTGRADALGVAAASVTSDLRLTEVASALAFSSSQSALATGYVAARPEILTVPLHVGQFNTLLHGSVFGVRLTGPVGKDLAPRSEAIEVALAPTLERLIASQVSKTFGLDDSDELEFSESLLTAVANGMIRRLGEPDGLVALDEAEHGDGFEAFRGTEFYEDVIVERRQADIQAGRPLRTKTARLASPSPPEAEVMWLGARPGRTDAGRFKLRQSAKRAKDKRFGVDDGREGPVTRRIQRPAPRYHRATAPILGLRNFKRSNRFNDGRFSSDGKLECLWARELQVAYGRRFVARDYLPDLPNRSNLPQLVRRLIENSFLLDPYLDPWKQAAIQRRTTNNAEAVAVQTRLRGETALRFTSDGVYDGTPALAATAPPHAQGIIRDELLRHSLAEGREPSPVGVTSWAQPWLPVWLEWEARLEPGSDLAGWSLGRIEFAGRSEGDGRALVLRGRAPITDGLHDAWKALIADYLDAEHERDEDELGEISDEHAARLAELKVFLEDADTGSVTLDQLGDVWLGLEPAPDGQEREVSMVVPEPLRDAGLPRLIASGRISLLRARVIDCFGRFRDLDTERVVRPHALSSKDEDGRPALELPPRLSLPARLMFRFVDPADASDTPAEAQLDQSDPSRGVNPIAGYILPDFIDESVEMFDAAGNPLGELLQDPVTNGLVWEGAVGRPGPAVNDPQQDLPPAARVLGEIARGMIDVDALRLQDPDLVDDESALSAFLRAVDTTMWGVDEAQVQSDATIAGLVGRPVAVVRATLWLDIPTDLSKIDAFDETAIGLSKLLSETGVFEAVKSRAFEVALGEVAKGHDGLYGYFVGDDFRRFRLIEKTVAEQAPRTGAGRGFRAVLGSATLAQPSPLSSPYIEGGGRLNVHSGQRVQLTLLMNPAGRVNATTGILPRKSLELLRDWVAPGLERIAPSARIGPVLIDPDKVRLPKIAAFGKDQRWTRRNTPITWRDDPILAATQAAILPDGPVSVEEGWIRIGEGGDDEGGTG
ncbi:hypothetical protein [Ruegeria meonggei]|uniref:hypothetical protein n=1 Tax=Ruegeria meonggei TaxID=1446476 RepID=UPI00367075BB